jgi:glucose/arabinose dehydrogenase
MRRRPTLTALILAVGVAAGGCSSQAPKTPTTGAQQVNGTERLGWNQLADGPDDIARMRFAALVDGARSDVTAVACVATADPTSYACSSRLPSMAAGPHAIQVIAINGSLESEPSTPPLSVVMVVAPTSGGTSSRGAIGPGSSETTADGVRLQLDTLASDLNDATDLAPAPGGWIFVSERSGRIRVFRDGALQAGAVATLDETVAGGGALLAIAVDPAFSANRLVNAVHTVAAPLESGRVFDFRITRLKETGGTLVVQVALLRGIPASSAQPAAALRFGPDGKLFAALDSGGDERAAGDLASFNGKVLRMNPDGTTPRDQAGATPVLAGGFRLPVGLGWSVDGRVLWVGERLGDGSERLAPVVVEGRPMRAQSRAPYGLPAPFGIGGAAVYATSVVPQFEGNLFVGADAGRYLLRVRFDPADPLTVASTERLLVDRVGGIRAVAAGADGAIYLSTASALLRLAPLTASSASGSRAIRVER